MKSSFKILGDMGLGEMTVGVLDDVCVKKCWRGVHNKGKF